jgi:ribonuclease BN (tRNA processing enzyme)
LHCVGYRIEYAGRVLAYSGDSQFCPALVDLCRQADTAVLDCSFPSNRPGPGHMHAGDCGRIARDAEIGRLILSHFYPVAEQFDVKRQAGKFFKGKIMTAKDLQVIRI